MRIRWFHESDARALAALHVASWESAYRGIIPDSAFEHFTVDRREQHFLKAMAEATEETAVLEEGGSLRGFATIGASRDDDTRRENAGEIWGIYIDPHHWRQGFGRRLVEWSVEELRSRGHKVVTLWVLKGNEHAGRFYEAMGFILDGAKKEVNIGAPLVSVRYRKTLAAS